jgi:hypothetical protein
MRIWIVVVGIMAHAFLTEEEADACEDQNRGSCIDRYDCILGE